MLLEEAENKIKKLESAADKESTDEDVDEEEQKGEQAQGRGTSDLLEHTIMQHFALIYGCAPGLGVLANTKMIDDVTDALLHKYDKESLTCEFPSVFDDLAGSDTNFEMVASNTMQTLKLFYSHNIVSKSTGVVFVQPKLDSDDLETLFYDDATNRAERAMKFFKDIL